MNSVCLCPFIILLYGESRKKGGYNNCIKWLMNAEFGPEGREEEWREKVLIFKLTIEKLSEGDEGTLSVFRGRPLILINI